MRVNDFMLNLHKRFMDEKDVVEATATKYIKNLYLLNNKAPFTNLAFLKKVSDINDRIQPYATSTKKGLVISIVAGLSFEKNKPSYKRTYQYWNEKLHELQLELDGKKGEMSLKQEKNWEKWEYVEEKRNELEEEVKKFCGNKLITRKQYNRLLQYVVLSLYTCIAPRRNKDYQEAFVIKKYTDKKDNTKNYYDYENKTFVFNVYKTSKKYGQQKIDISNNEKLVYAIECYLKHHPLKKKRMSRNTEFRFLVNSDGSPLPSVNSMTRILNRALEKNIGSSMLRHIYLTSKYKDVNKQMEKDASNMAHSIGEQKNYILEKKE